MRSLLYCELNAIRGGLTPTFGAPMSGQVSLPLVEAVGRLARQMGTFCFEVQEVAVSVGQVDRVT